MVFEGSDVPLEEDILKKEKLDFFPTWIEWATQNFQQILRRSTRFNTDTIVIMYTVPANRVLFITSAQLSGESGTITSAQAPSGINILLAGVSNFILHLDITRNNRTATAAASFPMPIKVEAGIAVRLTPIGSAAGIVGSFQGFEIDKPIS